MPPDREDSSLRLAELIAAFSLATDLGLGQPMEHVLRSWQISLRLGERMGLDDSERASLFYVALLAWVGCVADTTEISKWFGDDIAYRRDSYEIDLAGLPMLGFMLRHVGAGAPALQRLRLGAALVVSGGRGVEQAIISHCISTAQLARRLGLDASICAALQQAFTRFDGKGVPGGVSGEEIARSVRLFHVGDIVEVFHRTDGVDAAIEVARDRRGKHFDPTIVDAFCQFAPEVLGQADAPLDWGTLIAAEPGLDAPLSDPDLDTALEALADFTDLRSTYFAGHSRGVAALAAEAARGIGLPHAEVDTVRRAGLLHDIGGHGIPATIWDKPGALSATEIERVRLHTYYTERMLSHPPALARLGVVAAAHHERIDGTGYHRGANRTSIPMISRLLSAADAYHAMSEPRPYRPALTPQAAAAELLADVRSGHFDPEAVDAVLDAAGRPRRKRRSGPAGLTPREIEVLILIARGASNRQVAHELGISPRTAGTHIERIYTKIGASTRSTATLFAMQHGLLDTLESPPGD